MTASQLPPKPLLPLASPEARLENVGGKGANLARMAQAGLPVPAGFFIPTEVYSRFVQTNHLDETIQIALNGLDFQDPAGLEAASQHIQTRFLAGEVMPWLVEALQAAYGGLGKPAVAVRSSATAEDLADMSFAGQQDTYLNIQGIQALLQAVVKCWGSLWTGRAIGYRARNGIPQEAIALAVVIQQMVPAEASGVLFTANPLTGRRTETVIDATLGLGEALVSGQVEPDHYVIDTAHQFIASKTLGSKAVIINPQPGGGTRLVHADAAAQQAIPDEVILELTGLGTQVAELYHFPQDIEWAWAGGNLFLLQARPITSLYPLPDGLPYEPLQAMAALSAVQGMIEPITPFGRDLLRFVLIGGGRAFGLKTDVSRQKAILYAGERIWLNMTSILRNSLGRKILPNAISAADPGIAQAFKELVNDPRLAPGQRGLRLATLRRLLHFALPTLRRLLQVWRDPQAARRFVVKLMDEIVADTELRQPSSGELWEDFNQRLALLDEARSIFPDVVIPHGVTVVVAGMIPFFGIMTRFAEQAARLTGNPELAQLHLEIARGLPYNVTTEMDLALWRTAQALHQDPESQRAFSQTPASQLAKSYLGGNLPPVAQQLLQTFLQQYGMRGVGEIDIGRPRWREQPEHILQVLQSYLKIDDPEMAPDAVFGRGEQAAQAAANRLETAVRKTHGGRIKVRILHWGIQRYRALAGLRESPKFFAIRMMGIYRQGLLSSGAAFVKAGLLSQPDDIFFLQMDELQVIAARQDISTDLREHIAARRSLRQRELLRRQVPRVLVSDGTAYYQGVPAPADDESAIIGDPVSPGVVEGVVHVVLNPNGTQLAPGEILVCPGTDPAWTPLFLAAGGLVMEVGGMMTHGSVVAREYGIPAVVGVHQATARLKTGQRIRLDGSSGRISILP